MRQVHAVPGGHHLAGADPRADGPGRGRPSDLDLLLDVCDNISPGSPGLQWPPRQTTICPLGPSATSPIVSAVSRFRDEFEAYVARNPLLVAAEPFVVAGAGSGALP